LQFPQYLEPGTKARPPMTEPQAPPVPCRARPSTPSGRAVSLSIPCPTLRGP